MNLVYLFLLVTKVQIKESRFFYFVYTKRLILFNGDKKRVHNSIKYNCWPFFDLRLSFWKQFAPRIRFLALKFSNDQISLEIVSDEESKNDDHGQCNEDYSTDIKSMGFIKSTNDGQPTHIPVVINLVKTEDQILNMFCNLKFTNLEYWKEIRIKRQINTMFPLQRCKNYSI